MANNLPTISDEPIRLVSVKSDGFRKLAQVDQGGVVEPRSYNDLGDKPQIDGVTLTGDKSASDLGLAEAEHTHLLEDITDFPELADVATSGDYEDLENLPELFSGDYDDLTNKPVLAEVATSGDYDDLGNLPTLFSGDYDDLTNKPTLFSGDYADLTNKPVLAEVATSGDYEDLDNLPTLFSGDYDDLSNKPTIPSKTSDLVNNSGFITSETDPVFTASDAYGITSSDIDSWDGKQDALVSGTNIKTINNISLLGSGNIDIQGGGGGGVTDVTVDGVTIVDGGVAELETATQLRDGLMTAVAYQKLDGIQSGAEVNVQSDWNQSNASADDFIKNKPSLFSGDYNDLSNKPSLATVATTGDYDDLDNLPTLFSGDYDDLSNKPTLFSGSYNDLSNLPTLFSGDYTDLTNTPDDSILTNAELTLLENALGL